MSNFPMQSNQHKIRMLEVGYKTTSFTMFQRKSDNTLVKEHFENKPIQIRDFRKAEDEF